MKCILVIALLLSLEAGYKSNKDLKEIINLQAECISNLKSQFDKMGQSICQLFPMYTGCSCAELEKKNET